MSAIISIGTAVPRHQYRQEEILGFMQSLYGLDEKETNGLALMYKRSGISTRNCIICDYRSAPEDRIFYPKTIDFEPAPSIEQRMELYRKESPLLAQQAIDNSIPKDFDLKTITHLITVSCTGMSAPGLDLQLVQLMDLSPTIHRTSVNFMGCYAAIHGLKQADYIAKSNPNAVVLVVCVEICSIHFQKDRDMDNITANLLFGDGAAAVLVVGDNHKKKWRGKALQINNFYSEVNFSGEKDMAWNISSSGFLMKLSSYIPSLIELGIIDFVDKALKLNNSNVDDIDFWAIHPGGRKILEMVSKQLELEKQDLKASYDVLQQYGNMSSPTILFVIKQLFDTISQADKGKLMFGLAFGPGLTQESMVLEVV